MTAPGPDKVEFVSASSIRRLFNESQFPRMINAMQLTVEYLRNTHLKEPEKKNEPYCTHGQMIRYIGLDRQWVAEIFQYLRPDGTLGASGHPDPKRLRMHGKVYIVNLDNKQL